jgi:hypothetical protein
MDLSTSHGKPTKIGLLDFDFHDVSSSIIQKNTRVHLALTTSFVSKSIVEISIAKYPKNMSYPATWNTLSDYIDTINTNVFDTATTSLGDHMDFDVTDLVSNALENHKDTLTFSVCI